MKPEILAPAGTYKALEAAIKAGADAVYVGGSLFSARAFAGNFDEETLIKGIKYCHLFDKKLYLAVNTLLKPLEIEAVAQYIKPFYENGLDAVIVQDVGVAKVLRNEFPNIKLHASTQMSITSFYGAKFLKELGFSRVVPARELSLSEIKSIKEKVNIEIESFVHGAMCFAYSGKCLFSSFAGGRSGNRGRCAQPCRQCYEISDVERNEKSLVIKEYLMSLKDMCTLEILPELIDAKIESFKIEGRMKNASYVAATVRAYVKARDMYLEGKWDEKEISKLKEQMQDIYNRGGFSQGYYFEEKGLDMLATKRPNHQGLKIGVVEKVAPPHVTIKLEKDLNEKDVLEIIEAGIELTSNQNAKTGQSIILNGKEFKKINPGMEIFRTRNNRLLSEIEEEIIKPEKSIKVNAHIKAIIGQPIEITIEGIKTAGNVVEKAQNAPTDKETLIQKMYKSTGTNIKFENIGCEISEDAFVQLSAFNDLRRKAIENFKEEKVK